MSNLGDALKRDQDERAAWREAQRSKAGDYVDLACPNCGRHRIMLGADGKQRCEKCCWCVEDKEYDVEFLDYMRR